MSERQIINLIITALIDTYSVSISLQQSGFLSDYNILSTRLLVTVMDDENVHGDRLDRQEVSDRSGCSELRRAGTPQDGWDRLRENLHVEPDRPFIQVLKIKLHPVIKTDIASSVDLPQTSNARTHAKSPPLPVLVKTFIIPHGQEAGDLLDSYLPAAR